MRQVLQKSTWLLGGCLSPLLFLSTGLWADTVTLKSGKDLKGLVVEQHTDRIILSTEKGEIPILRSGIRNIQYDDAEQNFIQIGKAYESENKLGEALAYYEKALEVNPNFEEARKAALGVRNRFWAMSTEGPRNEIEKKQVIYDSWGTGQPLDQLVKRQAQEQSKALREGLGVRLEKKGDWVRVAWTDSKKDAAVAGLRKNDRLVAVDGESLRYLNEDVVARKLLVPRYSNFTLEFERDCFLRPRGDRKDPKQLGLKLKLEYQGIVLDAVKAESPAEASGLKERDLLTHVNGSSTRYLPLKTTASMIRRTVGAAVVLTVRRSALLTRR